MHVVFRLMPAVLTCLAMMLASIACADDARPTLQQLAKTYDELGLPHPPREAKLKGFESSGRSIVNGVKPVTYSLHGNRLRRIRIPAA